MSFIILLFTLAFGYFIYNIKKETSLDSKVKILRLCLKIVFAIAMITVGVAACIVLYMFVMMFQYISMQMIASFIVNVGLVGIQLYLYYKVYKNLMYLLANFEKDIVFDVNNVDAIKQISNTFLSLLVLHLVSRILNLILIYAIQYMNMFQMENMLFSSMNLNISLETNFMQLFTLLIIMLVTQIFAILFERAVVLKEENELTI